MEKFDQILARAAKRHGGPAAFEKMLKAAVAPPLKAKQIAAIPDDRYLSQMAKRVFCAGFVWKVVEDKWPEFERAFFQFAPAKVARLSDEALDELATDVRLIRNRKKIYSVRENAVFVLESAKEHGGFGKFLADWPDDDPIGLSQHLKKHADRLGGASGMYFLRFMGKDTFLFSNDVVAALVHQKILTKAPTSQRDLQAAQNAFLQWRKESGGRSLNHISKILACSIDA
ncbi:MAG: DNA-3-methyladenine glycosylase I [bacterium]|nr:DNA-3-methyladenine glycosylase I [bacterium]